MVSKCKKISIQFPSKTLPPDREYITKKYKKINLDLTRRLYSKVLRPKSNLSGELLLIATETVTSMMDIHDYKLKCVN